jgi:hypothetical protein
MMTPQQRQVSNRRPQQKQPPAPPRDPPSAQFLPPLKAHPRLAVITGIILLAWLVLLIVLRLTTVHHSPDPTPVPIQTSAQT